MPTSMIERLRKVEGHLTFYRLHVLVGLFIPLIAGAVLYASNTNYIAYVDALFMCVSALTTTGLTSVYVSNMNRWQQVILYLLFTFGSIPSVSLITLLVRRHKFRRYLRHAPRKYQNGPEDDNEVNADQSSQDDLQEDESQSQPKDIDKDRHSPTPAPRYNYYRGGFPNPIVSLYHTASSKLRSRRQPSKQGSEGRNKHQYLSFDHRSRTSRNSDFRALSNHERVEVGQLELQAMSLLAIVMITYMIIAQLLAVIIWAPYFSAGHYTDPDFDNGFETSRTWFAFFQASSMFNNCGLSLVDSSLTNFQSAYVMLVPAIFLMYGGYFGFPLVLRGILWALSRFVPANSRIASPLFFLRDHPRRVTYITFPTYETWVFTFVILVLTMADWVLYEVLDIGEWSVYVYMTAGQRAVNGLVQSVAVRSSGFYTTTLSTEAPALHISYLFMMVFGVYPFAMAIRASNVYEERHLGLTDDSERSEGSGVQHVKREGGYVGEHMRQQLAYDVWWLVLCTWIICIAERGKLTDTGRLSWFTVFAIIFEVASAYANVGFSLGVPYSSASFATSLGTLSKLVLMAAMIRGRTRELPIGVDRAILTPEQLKQHRDPPEHEEGDSGETAGQEAGQSS